MSRTSIELVPVTVSRPKPVKSDGGGTSSSHPRRTSSSSIIASAHAISSIGHDSDPVHETLQAEAARTKTRTGIIIATITLTTGIGTLLNGVTTVALPTMIEDLGIPESLRLWPSSIQALTCGCTLLLSGSIADVVGARRMYLLGSFLQSAFVLACGLSRTAVDIIVWRAISGIAISLCLPSAVSITTSSFRGRARNIAFACMGGGQPIGFAVGLTLGGVFADTIGWRWAFHMATIINTVVFLVAWWSLPKTIDTEVDGQESSGTIWWSKMKQLRTDVDWVGAVIATASLTMMSYVLASLSGSPTTISQPISIVLLAVSLALLPAFIFWMHWREKHGQPALIPNSLWRNKAFTTICLAVFLTWGSFNVLETMLTFYFQEVQQISALTTSLLFLPAPVSGAIANIVVGLVVHKVSASKIVFFGCALSAIAPLVMIPSHPQSSYWTSAFLANVFNPTGADALFTVSNLVITSVFASKTQALAGGVFNTISQIGKSVGLALGAVIASTGQSRSTTVDKLSAEALMDGYRATFWYSFAAIVTTVGICLFGLRGVGMVGHKRD